MRAILLAILLGLALPTGAQTPGPQRLSTGDTAGPWEAVGRLEIGGRGFCTGALIAPDQVITAAHCLFDPDTGRRIDPTRIEFRAGWRDGRAAAYRDVARAAIHPAYDHRTEAPEARVARDLALLELARPIRLPSLAAYATADAPRAGEAVGLVSYARERAEAPALEDDCRVLHAAGGILALSCTVDFGASGAPAFAMGAGGPRIVSVVSAMARMEGRPVALAAPVAANLAALRAALIQGDGRFLRAAPGAGPALDSGGGRRGSGARFIRP